MSNLITIERPEPSESDATGIHHGLPFDDYATIPAWNPSLVLSGRLSMLQLNYDRTHPRAVSPAMLFGAAVHCSVLEPDLFPLRYCVWSGGRRAGTKYDEFVEANADRDVLKEDEYATCLAARDAVHAHPIAGELLHRGDGADREASVVWRDNETGLLCKGRLDLLLPDLIVELKTTRSRVADDRALTRVASQMGYHIKLAAYQDAVSHLIDTVLPVKLIFVEQIAPHDVRVLNVPAAVLAQGWDEWQRLLGLIAVCERSGVWPGCDSGESELTVWATGAEHLPVTIDGESV